MPEASPAERRWRPTILATMLMVALVALGLGVWRLKLESDAKERRSTQLKAQLNIRAAAFAYLRRIRPKEYVPAADLEAARLAMERARAEVKASRGR